MQRPCQPGHSLYRDSEPVRFLEQNLAGRMRLSLAVAYVMRPLGEMMQPRR